ncbi:type II toxin-antitoxin system prevent-host-death family antitoxin [Candidatus Thiothrix sp. Deng01]|uniref:Antitoxin n=1 Tax=Candidatus Thiothrix phosphatis TaxID=3112415 RepID=A0ABU6CXV9_9GAMM|nr:type II toxin-antitoxin system prevent-host-death family antitoxin [Candidatus Thiothrix sp. Deng01]MEB4591673.1 type II toxin-antitoxin system prevent-host-death family antitoxin [Candidatus Thiothrix sp. Deng01]
MITMQSNEVKAGLSEVLRKVEAGQEIAITRHGMVVAYMVPVNRRRSRAAEAVAKIRQLRALALQEGEDIGDLVAEWKAEGRR